MNTGLLMGMVGGGLVAIIGVMQSRKGASWGTPVAMLGAVAAVGLSVHQMMQPTQSELRQLQNRRLAYVAGEQLGGHLATHYSGARATIFTLPQLESFDFSAIEDSSVTGLQDALASGFEWVEQKVLPRRTGESDAAGADGFMMMEASDWVDWEQAREWVVSGDPPSDVVVFTVRPPREFFQAGENMPKVGLLNATPQDAVELVETGAVHAAVTGQPTIQALPERIDDSLDSRTLFDQMYLLVTSENAAEIRAATDPLPSP